MNLNMIQPKSEIVELLLAITKNCEKLVPRETFHFNPLIHTKGDWMLGLVDLEVYNSIFIITKENNKFELYTDTFDEFSFEESKDELEEMLNIPNITDSHLEYGTLAPLIVDTYRKLRSDKLSRDGYLVLLMCYATSPFREFESYLRIVVGLEEDNFRLILKQYNKKLLPMN